MSNLDANRIEKDPSRDSPKWSLFRGSSRGGLKDGGRGGSGGIGGGDDSGDGNAAPKIIIIFTVQHLTI